jgi:hypothetical protein
MRTIAACVLAVSMSATAAAQSIQITPPWGRYSGTTLALTTQTQDGKTVEYVVIVEGGRQEKIRVPSADVKTVSFPEYFPFASYWGRPYAIVARVCGYMVPGKVEYAPAAWMTALGVTLDPAMSEPEFRQQIEAAVDQLESEKILGWKNRKRELENWAKEVRANGASYDATFCRNAVIASGSIESYSFSSSPQLNVLSVSGTAATGYYLHRGTY